ncbi:endonuclease [Pontibacter sp. G13]|uniref:endonuclease I family protein n=1 Tax=Pontibacter sp. G13 TaxID=3074898 RepID=UPI00288B36CB|nr:endonuclease [Pontibacter sp. G13]WNJ18541.1 endonuclease [Pontibacter sp. G13]
MNYRILGTILLLALSLGACQTSPQSAKQTPHGIAQTSAPDPMTGRTFRTHLKETYYDLQHRTLSYREARLAMYLDIDNEGDSVECVYSGYKRYVRTLSAPGRALPINCEHTIPQSWFKKQEPMVSDIHHLFPTYDKWNALRSSYPFDEIPDEETEEWLLDDDKYFEIPTESLAQYSEFGDEAFEPRNEHKGNLARAVFYFYTMYPKVGNIERVAPLKTLLDWHESDPVDSEELERNDEIQAVQGNRNPFIDHPEYAQQAWGSEVL